MNCEQQLQFKYSSWWAGGTHDRYNSAVGTRAHPPPYQIMLDPSLVLTLMKRSKCCGYLRLHSHTKLYINFQCSFISKILLLGHHKINQIWMMMVLEMEQFIFTMAGKMGNSIHINRFVYFIQFTWQGWLYPVIRRISLAERRPINLKEFDNRSLHNTVVCTSRSTDLNISLFFHCFENLAVVLILIHCFDIFVTYACLKKNNTRKCFILAFLVLKYSNNTIPLHAVDTFPSMWTNSYRAILLCTFRHV